MLHNRAIRESAAYATDLRSSFGHPRLCAAIIENDKALDLLFNKFERTHGYFLDHIAERAPTRTVERFVPKRNYLTKLQLYLPLFWPLAKSIYGTSSLDVFDMLLCEDPKTKIEQQELGSLLGVAAREGWVDLVRRLLIMGALVDQ